MVAMVAMTPLIAIQILGLAYKIKQSKLTVEELPAEAAPEVLIIDEPVTTEPLPLDDDDIIEL